MSLGGSGVSIGGVGILRAMNVNDNVLKIKERDQQIKDTSREDPKQPEEREETHDI